MAIETNLNSAPYYDDINQALDNNYHRILFRPAVPVQARELTQIQDILQNQIERFGDNIFVTGSIIKGCNFSFDTSYHYIKVQDLRPIDNQPVQPVSYVGFLGYEPTSNLYAICYNYQDGFESQAPNLKTLYFKYLNTGTAGQSTFSPGSQITFYQTKEIDQVGSATLFSNADVKIASSVDSVGKGYAMTVSSGILFQKGHFIQVPDNSTVIVEKYSQYPNNVVAGFLIDESIVTYNQDPSLLDNASGYTNYNAPGADRLRLTPRLAVFPTEDAPSNNFFSLVEWQNGNIVRSFQETQYSLIGNEMAKRTYEASGNFVIKPFKVTVQDANSSHNFAVISSGIAYIEGHRVEQLNNIYVPIRKGTDLKDSVAQKLQTNYDNSILVGEFVGSFPTNVMPTLSLRSLSGNKISNGQYSNTSAPGSEIGTAKVLGIQYYNGTIGEPDCLWKLYLTDIDMKLGKNFRDVKSVYYNTGVFGCADIVRNLDKVSNTYIASIENSSKSSLVFDTAKTGLTHLTQGQSLPKYVYRTISNTDINKTTGLSSLIQLVGAEFPYGNGELTPNELTSVVIVPYSAEDNAQYSNVTPSKAGNVVVTSGSANVSANLSYPTTFTTDYQVGDYIAAGTITDTTDLRRIINIANNTFMTVDKQFATSNTNATHSKCYPLNVPINIQQRNTKITVSGNDSELLAIQLVGANGTNESLSKALNVSVHHNAVLQGLDRNLQTNTNIVVLINTSNNAAGTAGPWCLGIPYAYKLKKVYKTSNTGTIVGNISSSSTTLTVGSTTGFSNGVVLFGQGIPAGTTANVASGTSFTLSSAATASIDYNTIKWAYYSNNEVDDVTSSFYLQDGQTDALFEHSFVAFNPSSINTTIANGDLITVVFDAFRPQSSGRGYISVESYDDLAYETIPSFKDKNNTEYFLRDSVDFRQFVANSAAYVNTLTAATCNPPYSAVPADIVNTPPTTNTELYIVAPDQHFQYDVGQYVGRIDKLVINSFGKYQIIEGKPSENPIPPSDIKGGMTLAQINIPPFPSYTATLFTTNVSSSYVTSSVINQNRVYTMRDIAKLDKRVQNLEYYTSLSLLEKETDSLKIVSDVTGANRFKNGIFVDNFTTTDLMDLDNPEFRASLSTSESSVVPLYALDRVNLNFANGTGTAANGSIIRLSTDTVSSEVSIINQRLATETFQCATVPYTYCGTIIVSPKVDPIPKVCNKKWHTDQAQPTRKVHIPYILYQFGSPVAHIAGGFDISTLKAGQPLYWAVGAVGYSSFSVTITGPNGYTYTEVLKPRNDLAGAPNVNRFEAGVWIPYTYPGTYTISYSKILQSGFTSESISTAHPSSCVVTPVIPLSTPDTGRGVGKVVGKLTTIILADSTRGYVPPVSNNQFAQVANNQVGGGIIIYDNASAPYGLKQGDAFNLDMIKTITGTPNTTTSTTSTFKTTQAAPDINTSIRIPGIANNISLKALVPLGAFRLNYL